MNLDDLDAQIEQLKARKAQLSQQRECGTEEVEATRDAMGKAFADGVAESQTNNLRSDITRLQEDIEGWNRAIPLLERQIAELEKAHASTRVAELETQYAEKLAAWGAQLDAFADFLREVCQEGIEPRYAVVMEQMTAIRQLEGELQRNGKAIHTSETEYPTRYATKEFPPPSALDLLRNWAGGGAAPAVPYGRPSDAVVNRWGADEAWAKAEMRN